MEFFYKKHDNGSVVEIKNRLISNINTINNMKCELRKLKVEEQKKYVLSDTNDDDIVICEDEIEFLDDEVDEFLDEINYYYERIKNVDLNDDEGVMVLKRELPSKNNFRYDEIVLGICLALMKEVAELKNFIEKEKDNLSIEDLNEFKNEIISIQNKINEIKTIGNKSEIDDVDLSNKLNNIVFLETSSNNIYALEDIKRIDGEYYGGFIELIKSIEDGTFKNVKFLTSGNNKTAGISEVKGFKRRVIFDRVGFNTYVIIGVFTKKSDKDKGYLDPLKNRIAIYRKNRDRILELAKNDEYLSSQKNILDEVYNYLEVNKKGGNNDGLELRGSVSQGKTRRFERNVRIS